MDQTHMLGDYRCIVLTERVEGSLRCCPSGLLGP